MSLLCSIMVGKSQKWMQKAPKDRYMSIMPHLQCYKCEGNLSNFDHLHFKKRNYLEQQRVNILIFLKENYVNTQQGGLIKEIRAQKGPCQVKYPLTPNNAHFMHYNSAPLLMDENALRWAVWLPPTTTIGSTWQPRHLFHINKVKCRMEPN